MFNKKRIISITLILLMLFAAGTVGFYVHKAQANSNQQINTLQKLFLVLDLVQKNYVEKPETDNLLIGAIDGMLESLDDPYTEYLPPEEYEAMQTEFEGKYGGIGIVITMKDKQLTVAHPMEGTPGDRAGLKSGDMIVAIDGTSTEDMVMQKSVSLMKGKPGTKVVLTIKRSFENKDQEKRFKKFDVEITRREIEVPYVKSELKEDQLGYIRVSQFINGVGKDVATEIDKLHNQGAKGFILDLRSNPGGLLVEASNVASNFIDQGPVAYVEERNSDKQPVPLSEQIKAIDEPVVILVNELSASASEIVTGAIQDNNRGIVIGEKTYGKGVVQNVVPLSDGSAIRLTIARYYTPGKRYIHEKGLNPDIEVKYDSETKEDEQLNKAIEVLQDKLK